MKFLADGGKDHVSSAAGGHEILCKDSRTFRGLDRLGSHGTSFPATGYEPEDETCCPFCGRRTTTTLLLPERRSPIATWAVTGTG